MKPIIALDFTYDKTHVFTLRHKKNRLLFKAGRYPYLYLHFFQYIQTRLEHFCFLFPVTESAWIHLPFLTQALNIQGRMIPLVYGVCDGRYSVRVTDYGSIEGAVTEAFHQLCPGTLPNSADDRSSRKQQLFSIFIFADYPIPRYLHSLASGVYCDILCDLSFKSRGR